MYCMYLMLLQFWRLGGIVFVLEEVLELETREPLVQIQHETDGGVSLCKCMKPLLVGSHTRSNSTETTTESVQHEWKMFHTTPLTNCNRLWKKIFLIVTVNFYPKVTSQVLFFKRYHCHWQLVSSTCKLAKFFWSFVSDPKPFFIS